MWNAVLEGATEEETGSGEEREADVALSRVCVGVGRPGGCCSLTGRRRLLRRGCRAAVHLPKDVADVEGHVHRVALRAQDEWVVLEWERTRHCAAARQADGAKTIECTCDA